MKKVRISGVRMLIARLKCAYNSNKLPILEFMKR